MLVTEHDESFDRLGELIYTKLGNLLPQHKHLLGVESAEPGGGLLANKRVWISMMEAARLAKEKMDEASIRGGASKQN